MDVSAYLERIGLQGVGLAPDLDSLRLLQRGHLLHVPFENLDIHWKRPITIDTAKFYDKIVVEKRGGFCYELNGLFNELLRAIGFQTRVISARVFNGTDFGPEFDHAAMIVTIGELEYLTDAGFGDFAAEPLQLVPDLVQQDREGTFTIKRGEPGILEVVKEGGLPQYSFSPLGRDLSEFAEMCDFQQYSPDSHFKKGKVCSILTATGRMTLTDTKLIITTNGAKTEIDLDGDFEAKLKNEFGILKPFSKSN